MKTCSQTETALRPMQSLCTLPVTWLWYQPKLLWSQGSRSFSCSYWHQNLLWDMIKSFFFLNLFLLIILGNFLISIKYLLTFFFFFWKINICLPKYRYYWLFDLLKTTTFCLIYPNQASFHLMKLEMDSFRLFRESICYDLMLKGIIWALLHFCLLKIK